jgi:hypothetical protein
MNIHSHKEPPLQDKVNHRREILSRLYFYVSLSSFTIVLAMTFAGVFD